MAPPMYLRSDDCPEFVSNVVLQWLEEAGIETLLIDPGRLGRVVSTRVSTGNSEVNALASNDSEIVSKLEALSNNGDCITAATGNTRVLIVAGPRG